MTQSVPSPRNLVLYADDDVEDRQLIRDAFDEFSNSIDLLDFEDGAGLLRYVEQLEALQPKPCLIIIDINMPRLDGKETLRRLRKLDGFEDVPAVLFSTSTLPSEAAFARCFNAGFVTKPLHTTQIQQIVDVLMEHCNDEIKKRLHRNKG
ncbi:MAG: response regulator [Flavisolibacter sp.]